ncbi:MAG: glycosyltransferase family 4 protein [Hydrogenophilales bacterium]|nr:glycosyltransferase family 4 protein [Hydrogenophilales bacterium]
MLQIEKIRQLSQKVESTTALKVCQLCAVDFTLQKFLLPLIDGMRDAGWEVTAVCSDGPFVASMRDQGYHIETLPIARSMNPISGLRSLRSLIRLFRNEKFDVLHVHTPVAALLGRVAAKFAGVSLVIHTAHGFYFHDEMLALKRYMFIALEWFAGQITDYLFTVSAEDAETAKCYGIMPSNSILATGNGVNVSRFDPARIDRAAVRKQLGIPDKAYVVGIVSRLVVEKGYVEFLRAAEWLTKRHADTVFLVVGERLQSDHAKAVDNLIKRAQQQLGGKLLMAGMREDVPEMLAAMDIYCLPSYREGLPTTVIEAMLMAKPVVATKIRGSREAVVDGQTGLLVPTRDAGALGQAIARLLEDADLRASMGRAGRERALALYDEKRIVAMQVEKIRELVNEKIMKLQTKCGIRV